MDAVVEKPKREMLAQPLELVNVPGILLNRRTVELAVGLTISTINRQIKDGKFPPPVDRYARPSRWRSDDIRAAINGTWKPPAADQ